MPFSCIIHAMGFTIKELETLSGIKAHTIRIWEQRYRFLKPSRTSTNIRNYSHEELKTLLTVALLNKYGYKISKIDNMPPDQRNKEVLQIPVAEAQNENLVNELIGCMIDLNISQFEQTLNHHIRHYGIEATITSIIFFFLEKIGILWQTGRINPAHEHIVSNIIRQKLVAAIEGLPLSTKEFPLLLLLLPENEHHELGLLFVYYLLRQRGLPVLYLGANVPLKDAAYIVKIKKPQYIYLHLSALQSKLNLQKFVDALSLSHPDSYLLLSGSAAQLYKNNSGAKVTLLQSLSSVVSYINSL